MGPRVDLHVCVHVHVVHMRVYVCMCVVCCVLCVCAFACKPKSAAQQHKKIHVFEIHVFLMHLVNEFVPCTVCTLRMNDARTPAPTRIRMIYIMY